MVKLYFPNPLTVAYPPTPDQPNGLSVAYPAGWNELDDALVHSHPLLARMAEGNDLTRGRDEELRAAEEAHREAVNAADRDLAVARMKANQSHIEQNAEASEEWAARREEASDKGLPFSDPHPNPDQAIADALTAPAGAVTPRAMQSEIMDAPADIRERQAAQRVRLEPAAAPTVPVSAAVKPPKADDNK